MTWRTATPAIRMLFGAAIVAGCTAPAATPSGSATAPPSAPSTAAPTLIPTAPPTDPPAGCPSGLPSTLASVDDLADAVCYGTTELTIDGWLAETDIFVPPGETDPSWTIPWVALFARSHTIDETIFDFLLTDNPGAARISVVTPPESGIDLSGTGRWVTLRGHFNDPTASACRVVTTDDDENEPECDKLFVVSALEPLERPAPVCPTESPLPLATYLAADTTCFGGSDVTIAGWEDVGEGFGGFAPIYPITYEPKFQLAGAQLTSGRFATDDAAPFIFVWTIAGSGVTFDRTGREVLVTGHLRDPASSTCKPEPFGWTWSPPDSWAQHRCERLFVVTEVGARG